MATAQQVLKIAAGELGYIALNDPEPGSKYGRWLAKKTGQSWLAGYSPSVPWCALFVSWVLDQAGQTCAGTPTASCLTIRDGAKKAGLIRKNKKDAKPGDLVLYDWDGNGNPDHVGIVEKAYSGYVQAIEGNTSSGNSGSQSNGGGVYRRTRDWGCVIAVVAVPYSGSSSSNGGSKPSSSSKLNVDGLWGEDTTKAAQKQAGTPVDGIVSSQDKAWKTKFKGCTTGWEWVSKAQGSQLIIAIQKTLRDKYGQKVGDIDGIAGKKFWQAMERAAGYDADNKGFEYPSNTIKWFQKKLNSKSFF